MPTVAWTGILKLVPAPPLPTPSEPAPPTPSPETDIGVWEDSIGTWTRRIRIFRKWGLILREARSPDGKKGHDIVTEVPPL